MFILLEDLGRTARLLNVDKIIKIVPSTIETTSVCHITVLDDAPFYTYTTFNQLYEKFRDLGLLEK